MEPKLAEVIDEGADEDEVSVILRLTEGAEIPRGVRVVARFGRPHPRIVTARCRRADIPFIHDSEHVASMKPAQRVVLAEAEIEVEDSEGPHLGLEDSRPASRAPWMALPENGADVVVGVIDYGLDFTHSNFRTADGRTRLRVLWDQNGQADEPPTPYGYGRIYTRAEIDQALVTPDPIATLGYDPRRSDPRGIGCHGTHVADILAGNRREPG